MQHEPTFRAGTSPIWRRCPSFLVFAALAATTLADSAGARISSDGIHFPTVTNFCGAGTAIVEVTLCNEGDEPFVVNVELFDGGTPGAYPCTESLVPEHEFLDPVPVVVAAGQCETLRIRITRPDALDTNANVCYWIKFSYEGGGVASLGAQLIDSLYGCIDWYFAEHVLFMHPLDPVTLNPTITNHSDEFIVFDYLIEVRDAEGSAEQGVIVLNDGGFAEPVVGSVDIGPGESVEVELFATWMDEVESGFFDVVLMGEVPAPGRASPATVSTVRRGARGTFRRILSDISSIGLARTTAIVAVGDAVPAARRRISVFPNPWGSGARVSVVFDVPQAWRRAIVHDAAGRAVRTLEAPGGEVVSRVTWDGRDDAGRAMAPGVYFLRIATAEGERHARVVRIP